MFTLTIKTDNMTGQDGNFELATILEMLARRVGNGATSDNGKVLDLNGNTVGEWSLILPFAAADAGCLFDGAAGQTANDRRVVELATRYGFESPLDVAHAIERDYDVSDIVAEATEYLNGEGHAAPEGYSFGWHDGDYFLQSTEWWEDAE